MPRLQTTHGISCNCASCLDLIFGTLPLTVTGTTSGSSFRPCGLSWLMQCQCSACNPQTQLKFTYTTQVLPENKLCPKCADHEIANKARIKTVSVEQTAVLDKALKFLSGLSLQHHSVSTQKEQADVLREIMKVLKPERYNK